MKSRILSLLILLCAVVIPVAFAETSEDLENEPVFTQQELDQMLAPIALYPDALLSQILMASTYPAEVVLAARWSREHPDLKGDAAVKAVERADWDPSVISLTAFPQILAEMNARPEWTEQLGDAFMIQQAQVMETIQHLRRQAHAAGNLRSSDEITVLHQGQTIVIEQAAPEVVYVPYYNPTVVYGRWWWDAYPPVYWDPWPGYYSGYRPGYYWGSGIPVGLGFFYSNFDWHRHHINVHQHHYGHSKNHHRRHRLADSDPGRNKPQQWKPDSSHRNNAQHGRPASRHRFGNGSPINRQDVLGPQSSPPIAAGQELIRPRSIPESVRRQDQLQNTYTPGTGSISERAEAFKRHDNRFVRPDIQPQTRAIAPTTQNPIAVPRQIMSQPQPLRSLPSLPSGLGSRAFSGPQQAMPNSRAMPLQPPMARPSSPSAQPRSLGLSQPRIGNNPLQTNQGQSGGGGHFRR